VDGLVSLVWGREAQRDPLIVVSVNSESILSVTPVSFMDMRVWEAAWVSGDGVDGSVRGGRGEPGWEGPGGVERLLLVCVEGDEGGEVDGEDAVGV